MVFIENVMGGEAASSPLIITDSRIDIHTNARQETFVDDYDGSTYTIWFYDEMQYSPWEYECFLNAVNQTKAWMDAELNKGLFWKGKYYTITLEKQSLLSAQLGLFLFNSQNGSRMPLTWNATGEACTEWNYEELLSLSNAISAHVAPIIKRQQDQEVALRAARSVEEIQEVLESFGETP